MKLTNLIPIKAGKTLSRLCIIGALSLGSSFVFAQNQQVRLSGSNLTLKAAFKQIEQQTKLFVDYNTQDVNDSRVIKKVPAGDNVKNVLEQLLEGTNCSVTFSNGHIIISRKSPASSKTKKVTGIVKDEKGEPIIGANVVEKGTTNGTVTDLNGQYSLDISPSAVLLVSYIGYDTKEIRVDGKNILNISLAENTENLDEIVVIGYGTSRKRDIVSAMSTVKGSTISAASTSNVQDALQGKVAGLDIQSARYAGDDQQIYIRGARSLNAGNNPLIIVDGIPGSLGSVNTYDIESIEVLKDAASSAIYGSMGANGVILVTTKRGKKGVNREVNFNSYIGLNVPHMMPLQSGEEYVQFRRDGYRYAHGWDTPFTDEDVFTQSELDMIKNGNYTDWQDLLYRNALTQSYHLSISNSGEKTRLLLSFKYDKEQGYYKTNDAENYNLTLTADHDLADFWTLGTTVRLKRNNISGFQKINNEILYMTPLSDPYLENGDLNYFPNPLNTSGYNPLANDVPGQFADDAQSNLLNLNLTSHIKINKWLSMHTNFGYIFSDYKRGYFYGKDSYKGKGVKTNSGKEYNNYDQWTLNHIITYDNSFGDHNLVGLLGFSIEKYESDGLSASGSNFPDDEVLTNLGSAATKNSIASSYASNTLVSTFARVEYKFKNRYLATFTFRADGSSKFGPDKRWGYFPSGALAWIISDESFLKDYSHIVSYLKLRASIGKTGSQNLGNYDWRTLMGSATYNNAPGIKPSSLGNDILQWESQVQKEIGLDYGFWDDRIRGSIGYYQKKVDNLLYSDPVPYSSSFSSVTQNIGSLKNKGFEFDVKVDIIKNTQKDLTWDFDFNVARNITTLEKLNSEDEYFGGGAYQYFKIDVGGKTGILYGYKYGGRLIRTNEELVALKTINPETGQQQYYRDENNYERPGDLYIMDLDGDGQITADGDRTEIGNANPDFFGGFGTTLYWKGLMVNATFTYSVGADRFYDEEKSSAGDMNVYNTSKNTLKSWTMNPGVDRGYPRAMYYGWGSNSIITNRYVHDASFLRLSALNISYRLPKRLFGSSIVDAIDLTFQATNLFTWTKYPGMDPQGNFSTSYSAFYNMGIDYSSYPSARTYNVGIKITLK